MFADHLPHELAMESFFLLPLAIAVLGLTLVVWLVGHRDWSTNSRLTLGAATGLTTVVPSMTWAYCSDSRWLPMALCVLLASPALIALGGRTLPRPVAHAVFTVAAVAVLGAFLVGQARGCWRDESYIGERANLYVLMVGTPMVATWSYAWGRTYPEAATALLRTLASIPRALRRASATATSPFRSLLHDRAARGSLKTQTVPSPAQVQRARILADMALALIVPGILLIISVWFLPAGVVVLGSVWFVRRSSKSVRAGDTQWSTRAVPGLAFMGSVTAACATWLLIWAIQEEFSFSSSWSGPLLWVALGWSAVFTVLIVLSLHDRRAGRSAHT